MANPNPWLVMACALMLILSVALVVRSCDKNPETGELRPIIEVVDTIRVHTVQEKTVYRDKIKAIVDTVFIESSPTGYTATLDTTVVVPRGSIETRIDFHHPKQLFDFWQNVKIQADTVYVNRIKIMELTRTRPNWWITAGGLIVGTAIGIIIMR